jgi:hypothetical protein
MIRVKKSIFIFYSLLISLFSITATSAVNSDERIISYSTDTTISRSGEARIKEVIQYDLGTTPHHGIYRDIPVSYHDGDRWYYPKLKNVSVLQDNAVARFSQSSEGGNIRIKIGDANRTISGVHTYTVSYILSPIVMQKSGEPFLNFDAIGTGWQVPIENASIAIRLESREQLIEPVCFTGEQQSTIQIPCQHNDMGVSANVSLRPYQGVTINASLPKGYMQGNYLKAEKKRIDYQAIGGALLMTALLSLFMVPVLGVSVILVLRWRRAKNKRKRQIIVPQYSPPMELTPAETGIIADDSTDNKEIAATIISLAVKGFIKITQQENNGLKKLFGAKYDYTLTAQNVSQKQLSPHEKILFDGLFDGTRAFSLTEILGSNKQAEKTVSSIKLSDLDPNHMTKIVENVKKTTKNDLTKKGYYESSGGWLVKGTLTESGAKVWALVEGFKLFLNVVEKDRLAFTDAPEKTPARFSTILPYAIALGVEKKWAKEFDGIDVTQSTNNWYVGQNMAMFSAATFASDISGSFSQAVQSNTSVSSSGGSSGGGVGGGGGGSW